MSPLLLGLVIVLALAVSYTNGFHDASNAVSTMISTRSMREGRALAYAALLNLLGALLGLLVITISTEWALAMLGMGHIAALLSDQPDMLGGTLVVIMLAALAWEIITWRLGMPSSSWHAVYGSVVGAILVLGLPDAWPVVLGVLAVATLLGPLMGAAISYTAMRGILALGRLERISIGHLRFAQTISASAVAVGHGMSDSRLPLALVVVACSAAGIPAQTSMLLLLPIALLVAVGTYVGGHRIIRTIGRRLTPLNAAQGMVAESTAALLLGLGVLGFQVPISSSHTLSSSVVGAGAAIGRRQVRWPVAGQLLVTWLATPFATAALSAAGLLVIT